MKLRIYIHRKPDMAGGWRNSEMRHVFEFAIGPGLMCFVVWALQYKGKEFSAILLDWAVILGAYVTTRYMVIPLVLLVKNIYGNRRRGGSSLPQ